MRKLFFVLCFVAMVFPVFGSTCGSLAEKDLSGAWRISNYPVLGVNIFKDVLFLKTNIKTQDNNSFYRIITKEGKSMNFVGFNMTIFDGVQYLQFHKFIEVGKKANIELSDDLFKVVHIVINKTTCMPEVIRISGDEEDSKVKFTIYKLPLFKTK